MHGGGQLIVGGNRTLGGLTTIRRLLQTFLFYFFDWRISLHSRLPQVYWGGQHSCVSIPDKARRKPTDVRRLFENLKTFTA